MHVHNHTYIHAYMNTHIHIEPWSPQGLLLWPPCLDLGTLHEVLQPRLLGSLFDQGHLIVQAFAHGQALLVLVLLAEGSTAGGAEEHGLEKRRQGGREGERERERRNERERGRERIQGEEGSYRDARSRGIDLLCHLVPFLLIEGIRSDGLHHLLELTVLSLPAPSEVRRSTSSRSHQDPLMKYYGEPLRN